MRSGLFIVNLVLVATPLWAQTVPVANSAFDEAGPAGWTLSRGQGGWIEAGAERGHAVSVTGDGTDSNYWLSGPVALEPSAVYRLQFDARDVGDAPFSGGTPITGPGFCNRDLGNVPRDAWKHYTSVIAVPAKIDAESSRLRFGQWQVKGTTAFDMVALARTDPVYLRRDGFVLGEGESVRGNAYEFRAPFQGESRNQSRPLDRYQATFNTYRWVFGPGCEVVYRHAVGQRHQTSVSVDVAICYYEHGELVVEASGDGKAWRPLGTMNEKGSRTFTIPADMLPATDVWVRLRSGDALASLQVDAYTYRATLDGEQAHIQGATRFVGVTASDPKVEVRLESFGDCVPGGDNTLVATVTNLTGAALDIQAALTFEPVSGAPSESRAEMRLEPGEQTIRLPYVAPNAGIYAAKLSLSSGLAYAAETSVHVADLFDASYGERLPVSTDAVGIWWASSGWKIAQSRPLPEQAGDALEIRAAANETEAAQLVLRPTSALKGLTAEPGPLEGPGGATIPKDNIEVLRVRYVPVTQPSDAIGAVAPWPDPLPPFRGPIDVEANCNQPLWVRVSVPNGTPAGVYTGTIRVAADGFQSEAPMRVVVYGFALPDRPTCTSAFGFSPTRVFEYQHLTTPEQQRAVLAKYLEDLSAHHLSPYNPAPLDPFVVTWPGRAWEGGVTDTAERHSGVASLFLDDANERGVVECRMTAPAPIPPGGLVLKFACKTRDAGQRYAVSLTHYDAAGQWMPGRNTDLVFQGTGQWQAEEKTIGQFPEGARSFLMVFRPTTWAEDGSTTGAAWFDDVALSDAGSGQVVLRGDFEPPDESSLTPSFDWTAWDKAMAEAKDRYHFTGVSVPIQGMGGGTFYSRTEPSLVGYAESTTQYKTAFTAYCRGLQEHLREIGWLQDSYVYWFDEPEPRDYEFVMNGFRKLKEAAPEIGRMLTEQVEPALEGGPNIWCPLTPEFRQDAADRRRAEGDRFWWYVCCGPKEPYCGLFIDHPATELRVWLWQTWQRGINGVLVWETTWWSSQAAYPELGHPQNPYEDPMGWTDGYGTPPGTRLPWGNGDGRFIYPPEAAADARPEQPVLEGPVDSIRGEMLRDGIEDYEYLTILKRAVDALPPDQRGPCADLLEVPASVTSGLTTFTKDPKPIETRRDQVARAIEALAGR